MSENKELDIEAFKDLAELTKEQGEIEDEINIIANQKLKPVFDKRREIVKKVPNFWPAVLLNSGLVDDFIGQEDAALLENLTDFHISYDDPENPKNFTVHMEFDKDNEHLETAVLDKKFSYKGDKLTSDPVELNWKEGKKLVKDDDDDSFFNWFRFTGEGPGDYNGGESLAMTFADDVFPHALRLYTASAESDDELEGEYDLEDEDEDENEDEGNEENGEDHEDAPPKKKQKSE